MVGLMPPDAPTSQSDDASDSELAATPTSSLTSTRNIAFNPLSQDALATRPPGHLTPLRV